MDESRNVQIFFLWRSSPGLLGSSPYRGCTITLRHSTLCRTPTYRPLPKNTPHLQETDIHAPGGIRTRSPSKRAATGIASVRIRLG